MNALVPAAALLACYVIAVVGVVLARTPAAAARRFAADAPVPVRERESLLGTVVRFLSARLGQPALRVLPERRLALVRHRLDAAGRPFTLHAYAGQKAAWAALCGTLGAFLTLATGQVSWLVGFAALGWMSVDFTLIALARRRQARIDRELPDFLDILAVVVAAGSGFRAGLGRVADALGGPLGDEVRTALRQMDLGATRRAAFESLRERNDSPQLASFVTALLQAEELGAPLSQVLGEIAADMRREFHQNARRAAAQATPRVSLIVTTLIVPAAAILLLSAMWIGSGIDLGVLLG